MTAKIFKQGAEGRLYLDTYKGQQCLVKERFLKKYRHPELDLQITRQRIKAECRANERCRKANILVPQIFHMDLNERKIYMEYFDAAITAKHYIQDLQKKFVSTEEVLNKHLEMVCVRIGKVISNMHSNNIIHGDLTTSNILININKEPITAEQYDMIFIDFGLSHYSKGTEDKGVDLYVLERSLLATHSELPNLFETILDTYRLECGNDGTAVLTKFSEVRARGRKRTMIG